MRSQSPFGARRPVGMAMLGFALGFTPACATMEQVNQAVGEAVTPIHKTQKDQARVLGEINQKLLDLTTAQKNLKSQVGDVGSRVGKLAKQLDAADTKVRDNQAAIAKVQTDVKIASDLADRVQENEASIRNVSANFDQIASKMGSIEGRVRERQERLGQFVTDTLDALFFGVQQAQDTYSELLKKEKDQSGGGGGS